MPPLRLGAYTVFLVATLYFRLKRILREIQTRIARAVEDPTRPLVMLYIAGAEGYVLRRMSPQIDADQMTHIFRPLFFRELDVRPFLRGSDRASHPYHRLFIHSYPYSPHQFLGTRRLRRDNVEWARPTNMPDTIETYHYQVLYERQVGLAEANHSLPAMTPNGEHLNGNVIVLKQEVEKHLRSHTYDQVARVVDITIEDAVFLRELIIKLIETQYLPHGGGDDVWLEVELS